MKLKVCLLVTGISAVIITSGCHKKAAVATPPAPAPTETRQTTASATPERRTPAAVTRPVSTPTAAVTPAPHRKTLQDLLNELQDPYYDYDKATLRADAVAALNKDSGTLKSLVEDFRGTNFMLEGECDERGSAEYNLALGDRRARAAKEFLTQVGVPSDRLSVISYGKEHPVCNEHNEACWQKNRRTHVTAAN